MPSFCPNYKASILNGQEIKIQITEIGVFLLDCMSPLLSGCIMFA